MTAEEVILQAEVAGCTIRVKNGRPSITGNPNQALLAALREHRAEILEILDPGGTHEPPPIPVIPATYDLVICDTCDSWCHPEAGVRDIARLCYHKRCPAKTGQW